MSKVKPILTLGMDLLENHLINELNLVIWKLLPQSTRFFLNNSIYSLLWYRTSRGVSHERHGSSSWLSVRYCITIDNVPNELLNTFPMQNHISMFIITSLANQLTQRQVSCYLVDNRENVRSQIYTPEIFQRFFKWDKGFVDF